MPASRPAVTRRPRRPDGTAERSGRRPRSDDDREARRRNRDEGATDRRGETNSPPRRRPGNSQIGPARAAQAAMRQIAELTGKKPEGVTAVAPAEDGWMASVEVIEDRRVPSSADVMAIYDTLISADGELQSYRRVSRYSRGRGDSGGGS